MIVIESKRKKKSTLDSLYPGATIVDVTSHSESEMVKFSPFYPHGGIPVPFSDGVTSMSVEGIWQGLKVFGTVDVDTSCFRNDTMKNLKRTVRVNGPCRGHRKGVRGTELLGYLEARKQIYLPAYKWVLDHKVNHLVARLRTISETGTLVLLDYETNPDVLDPSSPLSHAGLIKAYIEGTYPVFADYSNDSTTEEANADTEAIMPGQRVQHPKFGEGKVLTCDANTGRIVVDFNTCGQKTLSVRLANLQIVK
jgi:hypothetical protein